MGSKLYESGLYDQSHCEAKSPSLPILCGHVRVNDSVHSLPTVRVAVSISVPALVLPSQVYSPA